RTRAPGAVLHAELRQRGAERDVPDHRAADGYRVPSGWCDAVGGSRCFRRGRKRLMSSVTTWTRLELGCRRDDWNESLRARLHDPAWMLARQWQTAEFVGEDAGSPIAAEIVYRTRRLDRMKRGAEGIQNIGADRPLEVEIEREG